MGDLLVTLATGLTMAIAAIVIIYRMIDGALHVAIGFSALIIMAAVMALAIKPPHPAVTGVVLVVTLTLLAFFPYAEGVIERTELRSIRGDQMARSYAAMQARDDNYVARFELAQQLYNQGFQPQAIELARSTMAKLSEKKDEVANRSVADIFYKEQAMLKRWMSQPVASPYTHCPACGHSNRVEDYFCVKCGEPYPFLIISKREVKSKVMGKLVIGWALLALFLPGFVAIAMGLSGGVRIAAGCGSLIAVGAVLYWLFKPPDYDKAGLDWN